MKRQALKIMVISLSILGTALTGAGASSAESTGAGAATGSTTSALDAPAAPLALWSGPASVRLACGNTFVPPAPQGGAMTHFYKNCNGYAITVTTGYQNLSGQITVFGSVAVTVPNQGETSWYYGATEPNVNYHTIIVR